MAKYQYDINAAMQAGLTPQQIQTYVDSEKKKGNQYEFTSGAQKSLPDNPQDVSFEQPKKNQWADILPTVGGIAGSFIPGIGLIGGGAVGSGAGEAAKELIQTGQLNAGDIAKETALGAAGGVGGKILGAVAGKILPKVGELAGEAGDNLALKTLRPSKTQLTNFAKQHGEDMGDVVKRYNIIGKNSTQIDEDAIKPLQDEFNKVVGSTKLQIDPADLDASFYGKVSKLLESPATEDHKLAEKLLLEYDSIMNTVGNKPITGDLVNKFRQTYDGKVKSWLADPIEAGKNRVAGSALREVLQNGADKAGLEAGGQSFKQAGSELSKLYNIRDLAELQGNLGRGNLPVGLMGMLGVNAGGISGAAAVGPAGAVAGAAGMALATKLLNNPKAVSIYSKMLSRAGDGMQQGVDVPLGGQVAARTAEQTVPRLFGQVPDSVDNGQSNANQNTFNHAGNSTTTMGQSQDPNTILPGETPEQWMARAQKAKSPGLGATPQDALAQAKKDTLTGYTPQQLFQAVQKAQIKGDKASAAMLEGWFEKETAYQKEAAKNGGKKPLNASSAQILGKANAANAALDRISTDLVRDPNKLLLMNVPGAPASRQLEADYSSLADAIGGLRTGASVSEQQQKYYRNLLPKFGDSPETIQTKLAAIKAELQFYTENGANVTEPYGASVSLPDSPQNVQF